MDTVSADDHPVMQQLHKPGDEKRPPVSIAPHLHKARLSADKVHAAELMTRVHMPSLTAMPDSWVQPKKSPHWAGFELSAGRLISAARRGALSR